MPPVTPLPPDDLQLILKQTASLWEEVRGRRIFITGGTGFFGCWFVESFCYINRVLDLNASITVLTRNPIAFQAKCPHLTSDRSLTLHEGDVRSFIFPEGQFHCVVHAASETNAQKAADQPAEIFSTIVAGTERVLRFACACRSSKLLFISSGAVYGKQPPEMTHLPETWNGAPDPVSPSSAYAEGKRSAELLCSLYGNHYSPECKIARCWAFCGPHLPLDRHFAIGNFIADALAARPIQIYGDGTSRRSYLYSGDLMIWLWTILFRAPALLPINVGSAHDISILELAQKVAATLSPKTEIRIAREPVAGMAISRYVPNVDRARDLLELRERVGLEESIRKTAEWYAATNSYKTPL